MIINDIKLFKSHRSILQETLEFLLRIFRV